jgi:hypothetical protein
MSNDKNTEGPELSIDRRTVLRGAAAGSAVGIIGIPTISGSAIATETAIETCGDLDIVCAIDTSGSLNDSEVASLETGVNDFIDELPTDGSVKIGTLEFGTEEGGPGIKGVTGVTNVNPLTNPTGFDIDLPDSTNNLAGTPMPAALDIADQLVNDTGAGARDGAEKVIILLTDGGPNYSPTAEYTAGGYSAGPFPDGSPDAKVTEAEMAETGSVADGIKSGGTRIATVFVSEDETQAMTSDAISTYTDLPTYLETKIASSGDLAIEPSLTDIEGLVDELVGILADLCCVECPEGFYYKYEWVEDEEAEGECKGEFVILDDDDNEVESVEGLELVSVSCDEDGEPQEACFETTFCELDYEVKAGQETDDETVLFDETGGEFCVTGIEDTNPVGKTVTYAISNIVFTCPE